MKAVLQERMAAKHPPGINFRSILSVMGSASWKVSKSDAFPHLPSITGLLWARSHGQCRAHHRLSLKSWISWRDVCVLRWWERPRLPHTPGGIHITGASSVAHLEMSHTWTLSHTRDLVLGQSSGFSPSESVWPTLIFFTPGLQGPNHFYVWSTSVFNPGKMQIPFLAMLEENAPDVFSIFFHFHPKYLLDTWVGWIVSPPPKCPCPNPQNLWIAYPTR